MVAGKKGRLDFTEKSSYKVTIIMTYHLPFLPTVATFNDYVQTD